MKSPPLLPTTPSLVDSLIKRFDVEGTQETVDVLSRFAQLAVVWISLQVTARFRIQQDRLYDELQVTANVRATLRIESAAVVVEDSRNAFDVSRARIARDQMLN